MTSKPDRKAAFRFIVALGFVSLFADMTYEGAHSVIGPLLKDLGASATQVGIIAGLGEMIAASLRYFSGKLADKTRAYWTITTLGYFLNLVVVPGLAFAGSWQAAAYWWSPNARAKACADRHATSCFRKRPKLWAMDQDSVCTPRWIRPARCSGRCWSRPRSRVRIILARHFFG